MRSSYAIMLVPCWLKLAIRWYARFASLNLGFGRVCRSALVDNYTRTTGDILQCGLVYPDEGSRGMGVSPTPARPPPEGTPSLPPSLPHLRHVTLP